MQNYFVDTRMAEKRSFATEIHEKPMKKTKFV